jgi:nucleoside-diphosphate-sugar epimerase
VTGGTGVLGRVLLPLLEAAGHDVVAPRHAGLDLFDAAAVRDAVAGAGTVYHLATRIPRGPAAAQPGAWDENDRLRRVASRLLVDAALEAGSEVFIQPSVTFVYPLDAPADEDTPLNAASNLGSMVEAERQAQRFVEAGRRGVVLRFGLLWGPGTGNDVPNGRYASTLQIEDAGAALLLALDVRAGIYNVTADGDRVSSARFRAATGWRPLH